MHKLPQLNMQVPDIDPVETREWLDSFDALLAEGGMERAYYILTTLMKRAQVDKVPLPPLVQTPYVNTIPPEREPIYPGDEQIERRIRRYVRWNAMAMVQRANQTYSGLGGHLATYASAATLYEVGFHHFFQGRDGSRGHGDLVYVQGHAAPGIYARAYLEGRLTEEQLGAFRREVGGGGLSSYPHPLLMPDFWEVPTVSMGLGPISAIYQAKFNRYLHARGIADTSQSRVWAFLGDGECDEPEALGALHVAAREGLGNLIFVINCNLQRLDGPVRGNGKVIQELEATFHGQGWRVIKTVWGREWDPLLAADPDGVLVRRMGEVLDGHYQKYAVEDGAYIREHFFGADERLKQLVAHLSDDDLWHLRRGGHDARKVFAAYRAAVDETDVPTVILAKTIKGWTLGEGAEGRNIAHQQKKMRRDDLKVFRDRLQLDISDDQLDEPPFIRFPKQSEEYQYLMDRRRALGGPLPHRRAQPVSLQVPEMDWFKRYLEGSGDQEVSTTGAFSRMLAQLMSHEEIGRRVVPIIPDEARTFGLDALFHRYGIYSSKGQLYEPVDAATLMYYREATDGQVLEEGINEAGSVASFSAAGTSHVHFGEAMIPFYIFYSMFGFQRTADSIWAHADMGGRGFLLGATAGRTTLSGEGLQHQDGHSHLYAATNPRCVAYHPAFAYEIAVIIQEGLRRMYVADEDVFYYVTLQNDAYPQLAMPEGAREGIIEGLYRLMGPPDGADGPPVQLLGSSSILIEVLRAREILAERYGVAATVWSATSYTELRREALACERHNRLHPTEAPATPRVTQILAGVDGPIVAASDEMKQVPDQVAPWIPGGLTTLGTDGFGRSDTREALRRFFEVDAASIAAAALWRLAQTGAVEADVAAAALTELGLDPAAPDPATA